MRLVPRPREVFKTGDASPARSVWGYIARMSGWHQILACALAVLVAAVNIVPIDLQRRIVDNAIRQSDYALFVTLALIYVAVLVAHKLLRFVLNVYQSWIAESAIYYTRGHIFGIYGAHIQEEHVAGYSGEAVSIIGSETDKLGQFVGTALPEATANVSMLVGVIAYMVAVDYRMAAVAIVLLLPQIALTPLVQRYLNRLVRINVQLLRELGRDVSNLGQPGHHTHLSTRHRIYRNKMVLALVKFALKGALNLLNAFGPLAVLIYGGYLVLEGETTIGVILAFISGFERMSEPVRSLITFYRNAQQAEVQHAMIAHWMTCTAEGRPFTTLPEQAGKRDAA